MSSNMDNDCVTISREDIAIVADATVIRFPLRAPECKRVARMRDMLAASSELCRTLSDHTQHSLIGCQGTHGTWDLTEDADAFYRALATYAAAVREVAAEYRAAVRGPARVPAIDRPTSDGATHGVGPSWYGMPA